MSNVVWFWDKLRKANSIVEVSTMNRRKIKACIRKNDEELTCRGLVTCGIGNPARMRSF